ncbi:MAG: DUF4921 domain-containing protein [Ignavibacteriales bacterium CG07_land_8_20_14_0_80_59_12]|nr:MAG: DUF4921 domain-containing protein [Ignavibacteriales bacterium CG07_land_8_20_14_0_80_59_12]
MQYHVFYHIMPDGTVKQINPFTGTEVWSVPGRSSKPITNSVPPTAKKIERHSPEDYCSFCTARMFETPPEKSRLVPKDSTFVKLDRVPADEYNKTTPAFRRVGNLFEIVTIDYWRKNYNYRMTEDLLRWREQYVNNPLGMKHLQDVLNYKLRQSGKTAEQIDKISLEEKLSVADAFFAGGHELIIAHRHYKDGAEYDSQLQSSGEMTPEEHFWYFKFTVDAMKDIITHNRYVRYISVFQNWLRPAGASFDHLHKQLVALDEWGASIQRQIKMVQDNPNAFNEFAANFSAQNNLVFAENDHAIAFVGIGHRHPTIEIYSKSYASRPYEHTDEELRSVSDLVQACHAAISSQISCNEEWYYTPVDAVYKMPWHILIKWRVNVAAGFEGGTSIFINPMTPLDLRDKIVPRLYELRAAGKIARLAIAEECRIIPNPLKYYLR